MYKNKGAPAAQPQNTTGKVLADPLPENEKVGRRFSHLRLLPAADGSIFLIAKERSQRPLS